MYRPKITPPPPQYSSTAATVLQNFKLMPGKCPTDKIKTIPLSSPLRKQNLCLWQRLFVLNRFHMPFPWGEIILPYIHLLGRATDRQYLASVHNTFEHMWETMEHFWTHLRPVWALLNILKYFWTFLKIILPYLHHLGRATDRQYMAWGTFRMQEMSQIHPFIFCSNFLGQMIYFLFICFTFYKPSGGCFWQSETINSYIKFC